MNRLIFTPNGYNYAKTLVKQTDSEEKAGNIRQNTTPYLFRLMTQSQQNNKVHRQIVDKAFQTKVTLPSPRTKHPTPEVTFMHTRSLGDISLSKHHLCSIRLMNGDWFQLKNVDMNPIILEHSKKLRRPQPRQFESLKLSRAKLTYEDQMEQNKVYLDSIERRLEIKRAESDNIYFVEKDPFYKEMKTMTQQNIQSGNIVNKDRKRFEERLNKFCLKKYQEKKSVQQE